MEINKVISFVAIIGKTKLGMCVISIQYPCRYDRILPLAIHHPELAEVGLGRARVLRLPVGRVTRDT